MQNDVALPVTNSKLKLTFDLGIYEKYQITLEITDMKTEKKNKKTLIQNHSHSIFLC